MSIPTARYPLPTTQEQRSKLVDEVLGRTPKQRAPGKVTAGKASQVRVPADRAQSRSLGVVGSGTAQKPRMKDILAGLDGAQRKMDQNDAKDFIKLRIPSKAVARGLRREMRADHHAPLHKLLAGKSIQEAAALVKKVQANLEPKNVRAQLMALSPAGTVVDKLLEQREPQTLPKILASMSAEAPGTLKDKFSAALKSLSLPELSVIENQLAQSARGTLLSDKDKVLAPETQRSWDALRDAITSAKDRAMVRQQDKDEIQKLSDNEVRNRLLGLLSPAASPPPPTVSSLPAGGLHIGASDPRTKKADSGMPHVASPPPKNLPPLEASAPRTSESVNKQVTDLLSLMKSSSDPVTARLHVQKFQSHELEAMRSALYVIGSKMIDESEKQLALRLSNLIDETLSNQAEKRDGVSELSRNLHQLLSAADVSVDSLASTVNAMSSENLALAHTEIALQMDILGDAYSDDKDAGVALKQLESILSAIQSKREASTLRPLPNRPEASKPSDQPGFLPSGFTAALQSPVSVGSSHKPPDSAQERLVNNFKKRLGSARPERSNKHLGLDGRDGALSKLLAPVGGFARQLSKARIHLHSERVGRLTQDSLANIKQAAMALLAAARDAANASPADKAKNESFLNAASGLRQALHTAEVAVEDTVKDIFGRFFFTPSQLEQNGLSILQKGVPYTNAPNQGGPAEIQMGPQTLMPSKAEAYTKSGDSSGLYSLADDIVNSKSPPADVAKAFLKALGA